MSTTSAFPLEGGCDCGHVRYRLETPPLFVHCCHCRWCQRESGASFALNAMIEADRVTNLGAAPELVDTPSASGMGQQIARCPKCRIAVWSHYAGAGPLVTFVRVGTLDEPDRLPPDIHIFTSSKQPWVVIPAGAPAVAEYYERTKYWPAESLARRQALLPRIEAYQASRELVTSRVIDAPRERVFMAFGDPAHLAKWWGPKGFTNTFSEFDLRPGGAWRFVMHGPDGVSYPNESVFVEVVPPERVVFRHVSAPRFEMTITFAADGARTRVGWRQRFASPAECRRIATFAVEANEQNLDRLAAQVLEVA